MPEKRGPRSVRNPQYSAGGGGGGGLASLISSLVGAPVATEGGLEGVTGDNALALQGAGEENATGLSDYPSSTGISRVTPPNMEKPGFFQNMMTRGGAGQQYAAFQNQSALAGYHNQLQQKLLQERLAGEGAMKGDLLSKGNDYIVQREKDKEAYESGENRTQELAALDKLAAEQGFGSWDTYKQILNNPDLMTAGLKNLYSQREKQSFDNAETQAKTQNILQGDIPYKQAQAREILEGSIPYKQAQAKRESYFILNKGDLLTNPSEDTNTLNAEPGQFSNYSSGGPVNLNSRGSYDVTTEGKLLRPVPKFAGSPNPNIPPMIARPIAQFNPNPPIAQQVVPQQPQAPSPLNPQINKEGLMDDWGGVINSIPLLQDYFRKRGMFSKPQQQFPQYP